MNAHHETTRNAFDLSGFHPERHGSADFFNALYDVWTNTWNYLKDTTDRSTNDSSGTVIASGTYTYLCSGQYQIVDFLKIDDFKKLRAMKIGTRKAA